ncbi:D-alanine--D-alanine ligase [Ruegeria sediminis]|uniref:D-alanine--D-alanine ligase n=1 Tax=Ruegeria sediminis TaxID=2583820 RepID=A0ABY2WUD2_9RHOB|nr:D-alanine--D-alanine ligase [Ruegeria sediminis]TMV05627.1 D-alanine--D-alanine ligase [Ruegeria sediminis]
MTGLFIPVLHGATAERPDEIDTLQTAGVICDTLRQLGHRSDLVHIGSDFAAISKLCATRPDLIFNLVEAIDGDCGLAAEIPVELERLGIPFTGCGALASELCLTKPGMKRALEAAGLPTPAWSLTGAGLIDVPRVIVKSVDEHASFGIDADSVVAGDQAGREISWRQSRFGGTFFAETFVEGREFNISVLEQASGPAVLPPAEIMFVGYGEGRPTIVDYEAKWVAGTHGFENTPRRFDFPVEDTDLLGRLTDLTLDAWRLFGLAGYARVDFRVDAHGRPWILEVNTNPCLAPDAGFVAAAARQGIGFGDLIARIVACALDRVREVA